MTSIVCYLLVKKIRITSLEDKNMFVYLLLFLKSRAAHALLMAVYDIFLRFIFVQNAFHL